MLVWKILVQSVAVLFSDRYIAIYKSASVAQSYTHPTCDQIAGSIPARSGNILLWRFSWMRRLTGDQEVAGSTPAEVGNILSWRLIMKYFLRSFSPADSRRAVVSFWQKNVHNTG